MKQPIKISYSGGDRYPFILPVDKKTKMIVKKFWEDNPPKKEHRTSCNPVYFPPVISIK